MTVFSLWYSMEVSTQMIDRQERTTEIERSLTALFTDNSYFEILNFIHVSFFGSSSTKWASLLPSRRHNCQVHTRVTIRNQACILHGHNHNLHSFSLGNVRFRSLPICNSAMVVAPSINFVIEMYDIWKPWVYSPVVWIPVVFIISPDTADSISSGPVIVTCKTAPFVICTLKTSGAINFFHCRISTNGISFSTTVFPSWERPFWMV